MVVEFSMGSLSKWNNQVLCVHSVFHICAMRRKNPQKNEKYIQPTTPQSSQQRRYSVFTVSLVC